MIKHTTIWKVDSRGTAVQEDALAVEEPLEIRLCWHEHGRREQRSLSVTMRTPGHDVELATGFLFAEGIIRHKAQIAEARSCGPLVEGTDYSNVVRVELTPETEVDWSRLERHSVTSSSCGLCGKTSLEAVATLKGVQPLQDAFTVEASLISRLPALLREVQAGFDCTGGLHASALFWESGELWELREDVGRHNALDKLVGAALLQGRLPLPASVLLLSGRASYELLQKALMAGIPVVAAVGAPSSLAVALAQRFQITLLGFVREHRFNIYSVPERIRHATPTEKDRP